MVRGSGFMTLQMVWMSGRGVKYWPAPFLPSLAAFRAGPRSSAFHVHVHRGPVFLVNHGDDALEVDGLLKRGVACAKMSPRSRAARGVAQDVGVMIGQRRAGLGLEAGQS